MCICMSEAADGIVIATVVVVDLFQILIRKEGKNPGSTKDFLNRVFLAFLGGAGF